MFPGIADLRRYHELDGKTFLVCVGAMKCATSWIHDYLGTLDGVAVSPLKELHFFNTKFPANALGDMEALALGIAEAVEDAHVQARVGQVRYLGDLLTEWGIPIVQPIGGHGVFLDAAAILHHLPHQPLWSCPGFVDTPDRTKVR